MQHSVPSRIKKVPESLVPERKILIKTTFIKKKRIDMPRTNKYGSFIKAGRYYTANDDPILPSECKQDWLQYVKNPEEYWNSNDEHDSIGKWLLFNTLKMTDQLWQVL